MIGYSRTSLSYRSTSSARRACAPSRSRTYWPSWKSSRRGHVQRQRDLLARLVAGRLDGRQDEFERGRGCSAGAARTRPRRRCRCPARALVQLVVQRVVDLGAPAQPLGEGRRADRHDHELLEVGRVLGVLAAVQDVHHAARAAGARRCRRGSGRAACAARPRRRGGTRARRPGSRWRQAWLLSACRPARAARWSIAAWSKTDQSAQGAAMSLVDVLDGRAARPCRRRRVRRRRAARAPRGRRSRRRTGPRRGRAVPSSRRTSTSTVGFPRESRIWRPWTWTMADTCRLRGVAAWA